MLAELDADVLPSTLNGRPRIELPPKIARRVLDDLGGGCVVPINSKKVSTHPTVFSQVVIGDNCQLLARQTRRHLSSPGGQSAIVS